MTGIILIEVRHATFVHFLKYGFAVFMPWSHFDYFPFCVLHTHTYAHIQMHIVYFEIFFVQLLLRRRQRQNWENVFHLLIQPNWSILSRRRRLFCLTRMVCSTWQESCSEYESVYIKVALICLLSLYASFVSLAYFHAFLKFLELLLVLKEIGKNASILFWTTSLFLHDPYSLWVLSNVNCREWI